MFREERHKYILDLLERDGKVFVKDLETQFGISKSMISKDFQALEKKNLLRRTYGGAINKKNLIINKVNSFKIIAKDSNLMEIIAEKAYWQIKEYDTIFLDSLSITYIIANLIFKNNKKDSKGSFV